ncbi:MAG: Mov34/MPN/PAD-1 family protein [Candidatus Margulisiibacteriota bacterium]
MNILNTIYDEIVAHAKAGLPNETCGYLAGQNDTITTFYPMTNVDASPEHFSFDPKEQFAAIKQARAAGLQVMAVYHSHPESPARLSEEDLRLLNDPNMVYIIVSLMNPEADVKGYKIRKTDAEIHIDRVVLEKIGE